MMVHVYGHLPQTIYIYIYIEVYKKETDQSYEQTKFSDGLDCIYRTTRIGFGSADDLQTMDGGIFDNLSQILKLLH